MMLNESQRLINAASISWCRLLYHQRSWHWPAADRQLLRASARGSTVHSCRLLTLLCISCRWILTKGPVHDVVTGGCRVLDVGPVHGVVAGGCWVLDVGPVHDLVVGGWVLRVVGAVHGCCGVLAVGAVERIVPAVAVGWCAIGSEGSLHVYMVAQLVRRGIAENYEKNLK